MRLNFLEIHNVLSYGLEERIEFDSKLTALVGPNGVGKTNILRILTLVRDVIRRETMAPNSPEWSAMNTKIESMCPAHERISLHSEIKLGVTLTTDNYPLEQSLDSYLIHLFLRGIRASSRAEIPRANNHFVVVETSNTDTLDEMYAAIRTGVIILRHNRTINASWTLAYEFSHDSKDYLWAVSHFPNMPSRGSLSIAGQPRSGQATEYRERVTIPEDDDSSRVVNYGSMFPSDDRPIFLKISQQLASYNSGSVWDELQRAGLISDAPITTGREPGLERVLAKVVSDKIITDLDDLKLGTPATTTMEILASPNAPVEDIGQPSIPLYLSMLYRWSVGNRASRDQYSRAQGVFKELRGDESCPELQVTAVSNTDNVEVDYVPNNLTPENGHPIRKYRQVKDYKLTIEPMIRTNNSRETPLAAIGSGGAELLRLATFLAADKYSVVLLDEPAAHLHPLAQEKLLQYLRKGEAQYVFVTHAPGLLPTWSRGLGATIRVSLNEDGYSKACMLGKDAIDQAGQLQKLVISQPDVRSIPFAESVIFVSGHTELIVYPRWLESIRDSQSSPVPHFVNFNGDDQFPRYLRVTHVFGIHWAAVVDGKSFEPVKYSLSEKSGSNTSTTIQIPKIAKQILDVVCKGETYNKLQDAANELHPLLSENSDEWLTAWRGKLKEVGVFTLSNCWHNKEREDKSCESCGRIVRLESDECENSETHQGESHKESFEDVVNADEGLASPDGKPKIKKAFELLANHPKPSKDFESFLTEVNNWLSMLVERNE